MKQIDTIIVGLGLAGVAYAEQLLQLGKSFVVFSDQSQNASVVAGGLYNPTILKRFTAAWQAKEQLEIALPFYAQIEARLGSTFDYKVPILRRFASIEEQNLWFQAADKESLSPFLSLQLLDNENSGFSVPFKFGEVRKTGRVATKALLRDFASYLTTKGLLQNQSFEHAAIDFKDHGVQYKEYYAQQIVFAEGYGLKQNPFFRDLPLEGTKGEVLTLRIPGLDEKSIIKSGVFIIPLGSDLYRVGSTYFWRDKTLGPTTDAQKFLLDRLERFMTLPYEIISHAAGIRPTVSDRRPLLGRHITHPCLYVLNGMGSRGVLIAPTAAKALSDLIYKNRPLDPEMDILRFSKKL